MILAYSVSGLCNRLRTLESCIALADDCQQRLGVLWRRDKDCNCEFRQLFIPHPKINWIFDLNVEKLTGRIIESGIRQAMWLRVWDKITDEMLKTQKISLIERAQRRSLLIISCQAFYPTRPEHEPAFQPVPAIINAVDEKGIHRAEYVGVHIRRTDHRWAIRFSPLEAFVKQMEMEIDGDPRTRFYVASDDEEVRQQLFKRFPDRVKFSQVSTFSRNSPEGIRDAVIDLYSLGRCRKIIGSYRSSFSDRAAQIGNCPLVVVRQDDAVASESPA